MMTQTFDTNESDFHHMIYTMFKTTFIKAPPKTIKYRHCKAININNFKRDLLYNLDRITPGDFNSFENAFQQALDKHAPIKTKVIRGNNKPFVNNELRKAIATRSRLKNKATKTGSDDDFLRYKKQRNFVKNLNLKIQRKYFQNLNPNKLDMNKKFWKTFKPLFSDKSISAERLILVENNEILSEESRIAETFNTYFGNFTDKLSINKWPEPNELRLIDDDVIKSIIKYQNHPSIIKIRQHQKTNNTFEFKHIMPEDAKKKINLLCSNKSTKGDIPIDILKDNIDI